MLSTDFSMFVVADFPVWLADRARMKPDTDQGRRGGAPRASAGQQVTGSIRGLSFPSVAPGHCERGMTFAPDQPPHLPYLV
jgi:hypothetical protein